MERQEAIEVLRKISEKCGNSILIDSVSLMPEKMPVQRFTDSPEPTFRLFLQTSVDLLSEETLKSILEEEGLAMTKTPNFVVIYRP